MTVSLALPLGVAKSTLINRSREHQHLIQNLRAIEWEDFADRTLASKPERLKALAEQLRRLDAELAQRDLALVSTTQLHSMAEHYQPGLRPRTSRLRHASRLWCGRRI